jgi:ribonucleoside-diphosphate reductase alpha chain
LSGGGRSSGLMSFLKIGDRAAGAIKSGGTTRRAAKMVVVDIDHPDVEKFIDWKVVEEQKVAALVTGSKLHAEHLNAIMTACRGGTLDDGAPLTGDAQFDPKRNRALKDEIRAARRARIPENYVQRVIQFAQQGYTGIEFPDLRHGLGFGGLHDGVRPERQQHRAGHRRVPAAVETDGSWSLKNRLDGTISETLQARDLWEKIGHAAWASADPGIQYDTTINDWHTCPNSAGSTRRTRVRSTCSWTIRPAIWRP